jgi:hypothetical protein
MPLSTSALHPPVMIDPTEMPSTLRELTNIAAKRAEAERAFAPAAPQDTVQVSLTTVSTSTSFDAYIYVRSRGADRETELLLDSGTDSLVVPFAQLSSLSDSSTHYRILADNVQDPFGLSAKLLQGPVDIMTAAGSILTLKDCIFYGLYRHHVSDSELRDRLHFTMAVLKRI